jgi:hypothetical protein
LKRTTVVADEALLLEARHQAEREGRSLSALVQDAIRAYVKEHRPRRRISFIGIGESDGTPWTVEEQNQALIDGLDPIEGWSPDRSALRQTPSDESEASS